MILVTIATMPSSSEGMTRDYKFLFPFEVTLTPCPKMLESFLKM